MPCQSRDGAGCWPDPSGIRAAPRRRRPPRRIELERKAGRNARHQRHDAKAERGHVEIEIADRLDDVAVEADFLFGLAQRRGQRARRRPCRSCRRETRSARNDRADAACVASAAPSAPDARRSAPAPRPGGSAAPRHFSITGSGSWSPRLRLHVRIVDARRHLEREPRRGRARRTPSALQTSVEPPAASGEFPQSAGLAP